MEATWLESAFATLGVAATGATPGETAGLFTTGAGIFTKGTEGATGDAETGTVNGTLQVGHAKVLPPELSGSCIFMLHFGQPKTIGIA